MVKVLVKVHPLASLTQFVCVPAAKPVVRLPVETPFTLYVYAAVPPVTPVTLKVPLFVLQLACVVVPAIAVGPGMLVILTVLVNTQPLLSVIVTV